MLDYQDNVGSALLGANADLTVGKKPPNGQTHDPERVVTAVM